jgi:hypothetical protein
MSDSRQHQPQPAPETNTNANTDSLSHLSQSHSIITLARTHTVPPSHARQGPFQQGYAYQLRRAGIYSSHQHPKLMPTPTPTHSPTSPKPTASLTRTHTQRWYSPTRMHAEDRSSKNTPTNCPHAHAPTHMHIANANANTDLFPHLSEAHTHSLARTPKTIPARIYLMTAHTPTRTHTPSPAPTDHDAAFISSTTTTTSLIMAHVLSHLSLCLTAILTLS